MTTYHQPVLLEESLDGLNIQPDGTYVDVTFGGGGHSRELLKRLHNGRLIAFDQDADSAENAIDDPRFTLVKHNFRYLKNYLKLYQALPIDGLLADLGVSSHQFDAAERGFSIRHEAVLDMRMDRRSQQSARKLINKGEEAELARIFWEYGELRNARQLAKAIVAARSAQPIRTSTELKAAIAHCIDRRKEQQYLARVFQALRIEVNDELKALQELLQQSAEVLGRGGRLVVIAYHSLEDRLVKHFMRAGNFEGIAEKDFYGNSLQPWRLINRKVIVPNEAEVASNSRARSAKLRIAERK